MTVGRKVRIVLADDHAVVRQGFKLILNQEPDLEVVGEAGNGADAVKMVEALKADIVIIDIAMPVMNGVEATRQMLAACDDETTRAAVGALLRLDLREGLPGIDVPTLVMVGTADALTPPRDSRRIADLVPHARLVEFPGAGHMLMYSSDYPHDHGDDAAENLLAALGEADREAVLSKNAAAFFDIAVPTES